MSVLALPSPRLNSLETRSFLREFAQNEPGFFGLGVILLMAMIPTAFAMSIDARLFNGVNVWDKPLKFEFALTVYLLTLTFFARWLPQGTIRTRAYRLFAGAVMAAIVAEMIWIAGAAGMDIASHFNQTPAGQIVYAFMGMGAVLLTSASAVYAVLIARNRQTGLSPVLRESFVAGLGLVLPLTLITAGTMSAVGSHWIGGAPNDAGGLALIGWARDGGDLRVAHFFATHAMHVIPLFGLMSWRLWGGENRIPLRLFCALFVAFVAFVFLQALSGRPFLPVLG